MYADPRKIRKHVLKVCLDDFESEHIDRIVRETGEQRQVVIRTLLLKALEQLQSASQPQ
jgi:uncharacterized protein (DUF927 family)